MSANIVNHSVYPVLQKAQCALAKANMNSDKLIVGAIAHEQRFRTHPWDFRYISTPYVYIYTYIYTYNMYIYTILYIV